MTTELVLSVGALSLLDTLSPGALGVTVYLLLTVKDRLVSGLLIYLFTVGGLYFLAGASLMLGLDAIADSVSGLFQSRAVSWILTIVGVALFIGSWYVPTKKTSKPLRPKSRSMGAMVALGFTTFLIEVATALPYFAAIGLMTAADLTPIQWAPLLAGYNFVMVLPPLVLLGLHLLLGRWMQNPLEKLRHKIEKNSGAALSWVMSIAGVILVVNNINNL